jgi:hypothetical protein
LFGRIIASRSIVSCVAFLPILKVVSSFLMLAKFLSNNTWVNKCFDNLPCKGCVPSHNAFNDIMVPHIGVGNSTSSLKSLRLVKTYEGLVFCDSVT